MRLPSLSLFALLAAAPALLLAAETTASSGPSITVPAASSPAANTAEGTGAALTVTTGDSAAKPHTEVSQAQRELQSILTRQQRLFLDASREDNANFDEDNFKQHAQDILYDYETYIKKYPEQAAGLAAYGLFLSKTGMRREAVAIFLRANKLDPNIALVKNQLGNYLAEDGKIIEAANYFTAAINLDPQEPLYHYQLGTLLREGKDVFVKSGQWTAEAVEQSMFKAFKRAAELAPDRIEFTYRFCESYYDLSNPVWDEALAAWIALEQKVSAPIEKEAIHLHRANILLKQNRPADARELLATVSNPKLSSQKEKLIAELPENKKP